MSTAPNNHRMEALRNRKSGSVLQMIQTLEICSSAIKKFILPDDIAFHNAMDRNDDCCNDDDNNESQTSATSGSDDDSFSTSSSDDDYTLALTTIQAVESPPPITSTRRQRRRQDENSANYSDFCDNDLSRQIEAMALEVESAFENRHATTVRKSRCSAAELLLADYPVVEEEDEVDSSSSGAVADGPVGAEACAPIEEYACMLSSYPASVLQRTSPKRPDLDVPAMVASDSLASFASEYSLDSRSSSEFASMASFKKTKNLYSPRSNAEWAIIE